MKINLNERELHKAIEEFIGNKGIDLSTKKINIELTAGRKPNGFYADVEILDPEIGDVVETEPDFSYDPDQPALDLDSD